MTKPKFKPECEFEIAGQKVCYFHGVIYINDRELNFLDKFESAVNEVIIELLKELYI